MERTKAAEQNSLKEIIEIWHLAPFRENLRGIEIRG